jgi:hypothetical protein
MWPPVRSGVEAGGLRQLNARNRRSRVRSVRSHLSQVLVEPKSRGRTRFACTTLVRVDSGCSVLRGVDRGGKQEASRSLRGPAVQAVGARLFHTRKDPSTGWTPPEDARCCRGGSRRRCSPRRPVFASGDQGPHGPELTLSKCAFVHTILEARAGEEQGVHRLG